MRWELTTGASRWEALIWKKKKIKIQQEKNAQKAIKRSSVLFT